MRRTTIMLPDDVALLLDVERERLRASSADLVRQALEAYLRPAAGRRYSFIGIAEGDGSSSGEHAEELLDDRYARDILAGGRGADRNR
ncbi:MAG: ribbon-helix-helix protein, CopG family [Candidatus Dormibacteria bacterium]